MKTESKLGTSPNGDEGRDAVHVAIMPAIAAQTLSLGCPVKLNACGQAERSDFGDAIGIVDPFLRRHPTYAITAGSWFWLCLYPKTITGLRHVWEHPLIPLSHSPSDQCDAQESTAKSEAKQWLKFYVQKNCPYLRDQPDSGYSEFINHVVNERWIYYNGRSCHCLADVDDADELFHRLSILLDRPIDASYFEAFTCVC